MKVGPIFEEGPFVWATTYTHDLDKHRAWAKRFNAHAAEAFNEYRTERLRAAAALKAAL